MDARWGSLFPSLTFSATLSSMHHIVYITVRMTKFSSDVGTYASFGSMYICTETRIRSSHGCVPSPPAVSSSECTESNEALRDSGPVDSGTSLPAPPLAVPNHEDAALVASLFASHPSGSFRNRKPPVKSIRTMLFSSTSGTIVPHRIVRPGVIESTRTHMSPLASMSSTPHASNTHPLLENGHGRSTVTSTTWLHRPVCDSLSLRRTRSRGIVQLGSQLLYSSLSLSTERNGTSMSLRIGDSILAVSFVCVSSSMR